MKKIYTIALSMLLLSACTKDNNENGPGSTSNDLTATGSKAVNTRVFEITLTTTPNTVSPPTSCSGDFQGFAIGDLALHGNASQMGLIDAELSTLHHVNCNVSFATALLTTGISGQIVGANGDLIYYTGDDVINITNLLIPNSPPTGPITGVWTITGGTGRFAGATGTVNITGTVDFITSTFSGTGLGTLTY